ncbi:uncharacterized protein [Coffea arabica]|uniref:MADF domain-containing protein n=1 Tax=Coffea arabica TaxID=13443 RepID=A0ABM4U129_COFAR
MVEIQQGRLRKLHNMAKCTLATLVNTNHRQYHHWWSVAPPSPTITSKSATLPSIITLPWYSLHRGNLRANHWQEVADNIAPRCPIGNAKTAVQYRHKMEKLRKRYRVEIQRAGPYGGSKSHRYCSAWVHFKRMDANSSAAAEANEDEEDQEESHVKPIGDIYNINNNSSNWSSFHGGMVNGGTGFRIRITGRGNVGPAAAAKVYSRFDDVGGPNPNTGVNYGSTKALRDGFGGRSDIGKRVVGDDVKTGDPLAEMVSAIRVLGDGFVRMERIKMDMIREVEEMRMEMEMEMKRTEMIRESQQRIGDEDDTFYKISNELLSSTFVSNEGKKFLKL